MSVEFFGVGGPGQIGNLKKSEKSSSESKSVASSEDKVQFSSVLQDINKAQKMSSTEQSERAAKVQELKEQVMNGAYEPDLNKVSSSLLQFMVENS